MQMTEQARFVLERAVAEARGMHQGYLGTEHLLLALVSDAGNEVQRLLAGLGVDAALARAAIAERCCGGWALDTEKELPFTPRLKRALNSAFVEAGDQPVGVHHLLLGLLEEGDSLALGVLYESGITRDVVLALLRKDGIV
jgi:ATP-dependent Clp protease ATP-binding subunit ClpC